VTLLRIKIPQEVKGRLTLFPASHRKPKERLIGSLAISNSCQGQG